MSWRAWVDWMDREEDALSLAVVRIVCGLTVAFHLLHLVYVGAPRLIWVEADLGGFRDLDSPLVNALGGATPDTLAWLIPATVVAAFTMAAGLATRLAVFLTWLGFRALADLNAHAGGSYDELLLNILFLLLLSGCGGRLSVDARLGWARSTIPAWPRYVLIFQLAWMYFATALQKVSIHWVPWGDLDALWYILQQPTWQRRSMTWLAPLHPLTRAATLLTWCFEVSAPLLPLAIWYRGTRTRAGRLRAWLNRLDWRTKYLTVGVGMHLGIEATMEVGAFTFATAALYAACLHPDEWAAAFRWTASATGAYVGRTSTTSSPAS